VQSGPESAIPSISKCIRSVLQDVVDMCDSERYFSDSDEVEAEVVPVHSAPSSSLPVSTRRQFHSFQVFVFKFCFFFLYMKYSFNFV
jgi:hypothetical protein